MFTIGNMMSQVAGAATGGGTPLEAATTPPAAVSAVAAASVADMETEAASSPTPESRPLVASSTPSNRKSGGGATASKSSDNREFQFFFEDEVFRIDRKGRVRFGVVTGTAESYSSDDEEEEINEVLGKGEVRVAFYPDGKEIVRAEKSIGLVDRTLMPGDVVRRRLPGQKHMSGQAGYVRDVNVRADVKVLGTKYVIRNVPSERLKPISDWSRDVPVCMGNWIGYTVSVDESAVLKSSFGTLLEITSNDFHKFKEAYGLPDREVFSPSVYYPSNVLIGRLPPLDRVTNLTPDLPLPTNRKRRSMYTVESVKTTAITVAWTFKATPQFDNGTELDPLKQPKSCIKGDELANVKRLNIYESYMLQIHDRFYLKYSKCDKLIKCSDWEHDQTKLYQNIFQRQKSEENKQVDQNEQSKQNSNTAGMENTPSPSTPSGSRSGHMFKVRRLSGKPSNQRLNRSLGENEPSNTPLKMCSSSNSNGKKVRGNNDETWDTVDDEADEETQDATETIESAAATPTTGGAANTLNSFASQAARIVTRNFKRRSSKKKARPSKKSTIPRKENDPKDGDDMVVETLVVYSSLTVVWQDGSVESGIPSTDLYPIHHLDNHEFFPGDFVSKANDYNMSQVDYGVIQSVDHDERIAKVKWFNIYGNMDNPVPSCKDVEELSVYDLKDHADYQYRPGTMVIRVSNFTGEDLNSTAGQVIDNFPDGRVRVWWAKGHITMCYPQDLFEIHQSDTQDAYESDDSENSWETQSEDSRTMNISGSIASMDVEDHIISGIDRAKEAIQRLEKIFHVLPEKRKADILKDLLGVYNNCRFLDRFLKTDFFHEDYFNGILCRTKKSPQKQPASPTAAKSNTNSPQPDVADVSERNLDPKISVPDIASPIVRQAVKLELPASGQTASSSTPNKRKSSTHVDEVQCKKNTSSEKINIEDSVTQTILLENISLSESETQLTYNELITKYRSEYMDMIRTARVSIAKAFEKHKNNKNDSGVHSRGENSSSEITGSSDPKDNTDGEKKQSILRSSSNTSIELVANHDADVCEVFCFLIKEQMAKCREAIVETFGRSKTDDKDADEEHISDGDVDVEVDDDVEISDHEVPPAYEKEQDQIMEQPLNLNGLSESLPPLESPNACSSPSPMQVVNASNPCFEVVPNAPIGHHFIGNVIHPNNKAHYQRAVQREYVMLQASLPPGVVVRAYEDRMDLISVMMVGPKRTPYQNALFFFDFQMGSDYPKSPPTCHYISYCTERLNPNLYEEGKVCVSLLGTWTGRDTEVWSPQSTMLQVLVSIQGLILVDEPYYNEAGYEKQRGTQLGNENSRVYNEMAIIKIVHSTVKQLLNPPLIFRKELIEHFKEFGTELHGRMKAWAEYSAEAQRLKITSINDMPKDYVTPCEMPEFPLLPCSRGFCIAVKGVLETLQNELGALEKMQINEATVPVVPTAPRAAPEDV